MLPDPFRQDLFKRLKPVFGSRIDALWLEYQIGTPDRRREIEDLLTILAVRRLGIALGDERIVLEPPPAQLIGSGEYAIGNVSYPGLSMFPCRLRRQELLRHTFLLGPTGTGKSTLIIGLLRELLRDGVPFMAFDFKRNYRCLLNEGNVLVLSVGRNLAPVNLDALSPPAAVEFATWADALSDVISASYLLMQGARNVLKSALLQAHEQYGSGARLFHAHQLVIAELGRLRPGSRRFGWLESTARSLEEISTGEFGRALNATTPTNIFELLQRPIVFELEHLGDDQKRFFCLYILQAVLLLRKHENSPRELLRHVLVFDESHNVFPREQWGQLSVPSRLAREVREYGEAIIAATQQADVAESLIANSGIKIVLRTDYPKDVEFASKLLGVEPRWLSKIPMGQAIVRLPSRYYQAFLITFPEQLVKNTVVPDSVVRERWTQSSMATPQTPSRDILGGRVSLSPKEAALLGDVAAQSVHASWNGQCCVTGCTVPALLRASHIVPWSEAVSSRVDETNGLLLCAAYDAAFDRLLITFADDGHIRLAPDLPKEQATMAGIDPSARIIGLSGAHHAFLARHRAAFDRRARGQEPWQKPPA